MPDPVQCNANQTRAMNVLTYKFEKSADASLMVPDKVEYVCVDNNPETESNKFYQAASFLGHILSGFQMSTPDGGKI